jgi:hypothetical protein
MKSEMDKREKRRRNLARYRTLRDLITDARAIEAIDEAIRKTEGRLAEIEASREDDTKPSCGR